MEYHNIKTIEESVNAYVADNKLPSSLQIDCSEGSTMLSAYVYVSFKQPAYIQEDTVRYASIQICISACT